MAVNVKIGDKVRYLNSVGGGVVTRFQSKDIVLVEEEDGFETPCLVSQVVVVQETNKYNFPVEDPIKEINNKKSSKGQSVEVMPEEVEEEIKVPEYTWNERYETPDGEQLTIYLAFVPKDINNFLFGKNFERTIDRVEVFWYNKKRALPVNGLFCIGRGEGERYEGF